MDKQLLVTLSDKALKSLIATTNPTGAYANEVKWAIEELDRRGVDYTDCLGGED
jgi:hypothetical protein